METIWWEVSALAAQCPQCGLIQSTDTMPMVFEENYFNRAAAAEPEIRVNHFRKLIGTLPVPLTSPLLDVGAGLGFFRQALTPELRESTVLVEPSAYARLVTQAKDDVNVFASIEEIPSEQARFNTVTIWDVLAHVHTPLELLTQIKRRMSANGQLIIKTPYHPRRIFRMAQMLAPFKKGHSLLNIPSMVLHFTPESIEPLLAKAGFTLRSWIWASEPPIRWAKNRATLKGIMLLAGRRVTAVHESFIAIAG